MKKTELIDIIQHSERVKAARNANVRFSLRVGELICDRIAVGHTLVKALKMVGPLAPGPTLFFRWLQKSVTLKQRYEEARIMQAEILADKQLEYAEAAIETPAKASAYKVAAEILRWQSEKRDSARFGNKIRVEREQEPLDPTKLRQEADRLEKELGVNHGSEKKDAVASAVGAAEGTQDLQGQVPSPATTFNVPKSLQ